MPGGFEVTSRATRASLVIRLQDRATTPYGGRVRSVVDSERGDRITGAQVVAALTAHVTDDADAETGDRAGLVLAAPAPPPESATGTARSSPGVCGAVDPAPTGLRSGRTRSTGSGPQRALTVRVASRNRASDSYPVTPMARRSPPIRLTEPSSRCAGPFSTTSIGPRRSRRS